MRLAIPATVPFLVLLSAAVTAADCKLSAQHDFEVDAAALDTLALHLGASDAWVEGVPGLAKVEVRARACASRQDWLDALGVEHAVEGGHLSVTPRTPTSTVNINLFGASYAWIELRIRAPARLALAVETGAGDVDVRGVASLDFDSGAGDLRVNDIAGPLVLALGSADVVGAGVGALELRRTGSGDVSLREVRGDAQLRSVGSGDIRLDSVAGSVTAGDVGSGDLTFERVGGDVKVDSIGSGDLSVRDVGGGLRVRAQGSGDIDHHGVRGPVELPPVHED